LVQTLLARVATNLGDGLGSMLDLLAQELVESVRIYGLDSRTEDLRGASFQNGAAVLRATDGTVFTLMTVHRADFQAYPHQLDQLDSGTWKASSSSAAAATAQGRATG
jgi:hypothetical protein